MLDAIFDFIDRYTALVIGLVVAVVLALVALVPVLEYNHDVWHTACHVNGKDRTTDSKGNSSMRIYTDNCGVLSTQDAFWIGHFNSADTYNSIHIGGTYDFETIGFRVPLFSMFPNIISVRAAS